MAFRVLTSSERDAFEVISALQKCIRRNMEREAMLLAIELATSSKGCYTMLLNRLRVIAHEDIGLANPDAVNFAMLTCAAAADMFEKNGWLIMVGNVVRTLARSEKCREGDHFVICCKHQLAQDGPLAIPDFALDQHTRAGKRLGRGVEHFLTEGTVLVPEPTRGDMYRDEAHARLRASGNETPPRCGQRKMFD